MTFRDRSENGGYHMSQGEQIVSAIRDALDMDDGETLVVQTPKFERSDGVGPSEPPLTEAAMDRLKKADRSELKALGLRRWSDVTGLWLFPHEWHPHIPEEYPLTDINGERTCRAEYPATPDKRFGVLSFGIVPEFERPETQAVPESDGDE